LISFCPSGYNRRNEKITSEALRERGYDQNGWPYSPCGIPQSPMVLTRNINVIPSAVLRVTFRLNNVLI